MTEPQTKKKQNLVVNFKYGPAPSDPLYEHLLYSTEVEVYLTAKKGKAWLEMKAAIPSLNAPVRRIMDGCWLRTAHTVQALLV